MTTLTFDMRDLKPIIEHARAAKKFRVAYGIGEPTPALFFVKDSGIYLMSAGLPGLRIAKGKPHHVVAYAKGYRADDPDSWDRCRDAVGGDDFAETLPLDWFTAALDAGAVLIHLHVGATQIEMTTTTKPPH